MKPVIQSYFTCDPYISISIQKNEFEHQLDHPTLAMVLKTQAPCECNAVYFSGTGPLLSHPFSHQTRASQKEPSPEEPNKTFSRKLAKAESPSCLTPKTEQGLVHIPEAKKLQDTTTHKRRRCRFPINHLLKNLTKLSLERLKTILVAKKKKLKHVRSITLKCSLFVARM